MRVNDTATAASQSRHNRVSARRCRVIFTRPAADDNFFTLVQRILVLYARATGGAGKSPCVSTACATDDGFLTLVQQILRVSRPASSTVHAADGGFFTLAQQKVDGRAEDIAGPLLSLIVLVNPRIFPDLLWNGTYWKVKMLTLKRRSEHMFQSAGPEILWRISRRDPPIRMKRVLPGRCNYTGVSE
ncbi:hypothetical protein FB451DRAFT_1173066 [Mycena latifolia]|nr:hypothetical protein FB451DRAFT_1173066 [Mycena latifolia]